MSLTAPVCPVSTAEPVPAALANCRRKKRSLSKKDRLLFLFYLRPHGHRYGQEVRTGVTNWEVLRPYLPQEWVSALAHLPPSIGECVQEVRLRADCPVTVYRW